MASCIKCGGMLDEFDAGGDMICQNCEASGGAAGANANVPCQRCGMYLPSYELRMWNSRLYCSYCIMDLQDEEKRARAAGEGRRAEEAGSKVPGICERCGRDADRLYTVQGRKLCGSCYSVGSGTGGAGAPSVFGMIVEKVAVALGVRQKPKVVPVLPLEKLRVRADAAPKSEDELRKSMEKFNVRERRMMEQEEGELGVEEPLSEGRSAEKKPSPEARKKFFSKLAGEKKD